MNDPMRADLERYLAGGLSPDEARSFLESVRRDPDALVLLGRALEDQAYLYDALAPRAEIGTRPSQDSTRILRTRRLLPRRRAEGGPASGWIVGAIAASAAVVLLLYASSTPAPRPKPAPPPPVAKLVELPVAPAPEPAPPPPVPAPRVEPPAPVPPPPRTPSPSVDPPVPPPAPKEKPFDSAPDRPAVTVAKPPPEPPKKAIGSVEQAGVGTPLVSGQAVEGPALVRFTDGTKVDLGPGTSLGEIVEDGTGKRIALTTGAILSDVVKQPAGKPLLVTTPHAVARVIGTVFRLSVDGRSTRLEVRDGKVQLRRTADNRTVDVAAGSFAVAGDSVDLAAKPSPIDDILLTPAQGEIGGTEWRAVADPAASTGIALEVLRTTNRQPHKQLADSARVTYVFRADAGRDYYVWVRGFAPSKNDPIKHDAVVLEFVDGKAAEREGPSKGLAGGPANALFNGFMHAPGYWWVGGDADAKNDEPPVVVRFSRPGLQTVRLYASEVPMRVDSIWISATQKTRPEADRK